ncbi:helix-turn-helix domain-containing protein [Jiulongibacter sp. NS-SX5]|uniref:helix-turn-helix domain-containing protein n=1 Tax=Jiulongibacter sp. NS-SX5 TaxID=3463854 RepID=UPI00405A006B
MSTVNNKQKPFRHVFYSVALKVGGSGKAVTSHYRDFPEGSVIFFNSPFQVISWDIEPDWQGYYIMITQDFLKEYNLFDRLLEDFPFLKMELAVPFSISVEQAKEALAIYDKIYAEYHSDHEDKFDLIASYVLLLLRLTKRFLHHDHPEKEYKKAINQADVSIWNRYEELLHEYLRTDVENTTNENTHSPLFYAEVMNIHPNYLNSVVKSVTGKTAIYHIHERLIDLAKTYLRQTNYSIKEIAYKLHFERPNNFSSFFKKYNSVSPVVYRNQSNL